MRLSHRRGVIDVHCIAVWCNTPRNSRTRVVVLAFVDGSWSWWRAHVLTTLAARVRNNGRFFKVSAVATINLALIMILNHSLRLRSHVGSDGSEIRAEVRNVLDKIALFGYRPIARCTWLGSRRRSCMFAFQLLLNRHWLRVVLLNVDWMRRLGRYASVAGVEPCEQAGLSQTLDHSCVILRRQAWNEARIWRHGRRCRYLGERLLRCFRFATWLLTHTFPTFGLLLRHRLAILF